MSDDELSDLIRRDASRHRASAGLRAAVRTQIALHAAAQPLDTVARPPEAPMPQAPGPARFGWRALAGAFAGGAVLAASLALILPRLDGQGGLPAELVADHVRSLRSGPLFEVASADRHAVKPWFQGRLDYAPQVFDLAAEGFPLLGGRVEIVAGRATAALAYARRQHVLNVFVWPADAAQSPRSLQRSGFNLLHWSDGAMQVWLVSDLDAAELEGFAGLWRLRAAPP